MAKAVFEGLVHDENGNICPVAFVGPDPTYVIDEGGFLYHVDARKVDAQVLDVFTNQVREHAPEVTEGILKMLGSNDLFTKAQVDSNLRNFDKNVGTVHENGIPESARVYLGMLGFRVVIDRHGEVKALNFPSMTDDDGG